MFDSSKSRAILIGIGTFLKDDDLHRREHVYKDISLLRDTLTDTQILGIHEKNIISLVDSEGNTMIKERIAEVANATQDTLILFYSGYLIERKGKLIISSPHTTISQSHINGIPLNEVLEIISESEAKRVFLILDTDYRNAKKTNDKPESKSIQELLPQGPKKTYIVSEFGKSNSNKTIASELTDLFQTGIEEEREVLTLNDVKEHFNKDNELRQVLFITNEEDDIPICLNKRFSKAKKLRTEIDAKFEEKNFEEALPLLKEGIELFENDDEFNNMATFIETLHQADQMFANESYDAAKNRYQAAYEIINEDTAFKGIIKSLEKIATIQYDNEDFEASKITYTELLKYDSNNELYNDKVKYCDNELNFASHIDLGDKAYFENKFTIAKDHYSKALDFREDALVLRRKEECDKILSREEKLRQEIKAELEEEIKASLDKEVEEQIKNKELELKKQLRAQLEDELSSEILPKAKDEVTQELETTIWKKTAIWNSIEGYQFYLSMFPEGHFIAKANQRIDQIHKKKLAQKMGEISPIPVAKIIDKKEEKIEEINIERALLMDLRMEPIEDILAKIEESRGLKGEVLLWTDNERIQLERNEEENEYVAPPSPAITELDEVMDEAIREVEEEDNVSFPAVEVTEVSSDSFSVEEAKELSETAKEVKEEEVVQDAIIEEVVDLADTNSNPVTATSAPENNSALEQLSEEELWIRSEQLNTKEGYLEYINYTKTADQIAEAYYRINKIDQGETPEVSAVAASASTPIIENTVAEEEEVVETPTLTEISEVNEIETEEVQEIVMNEETHTEEVEAETPVVSNSVFIDGMDEETLWKTALSINTIDSYKEYLNRTEANSYLADAYSNINTIQNGEVVDTSTADTEEQIEFTPTFETIEFGDTEESTTPENEITSFELEDIPEVASNDLQNEIDQIIGEDASPSNNVEINDTPAPDESTSTEEEVEVNLETEAEVEVETAPIVEEVPEPEVKVEVPTATDQTPTDEEIFELNEDEEDLWKNTCEENTLGAYFNYLNLTTQKKYWKEAKDKISALKNDSQAKEEEDWKRAQEIDTIEGYKTYIRKYPLGNYYAAAMMRLGKLE
ncbi:hypothetical protein [Flammeovirga aprica]|uniref:Caspase family p20 domain-containing protein n=1 Tax=Flammeovirga aprica JL-4 TaxID=694437 RepID=A0A7X9RT01_9BACT|nr:hypothetical protein [Flammeovirga aprica]NME66664.1 hypothetical protein [Flammeovirga aprica JL-4]